MTLPFLSAFSSFFSFFSGLFVFSSILIDFSISLLISSFQSYHHITVSLYRHSGNLLSDIEKSWKSLEIELFFSSPTHLALISLSHRCHAVPAFILHIFSSYLLVLFILCSTEALHHLLGLCSSPLLFLLSSHFCSSSGFVAYLPLLLSFFFSSKEASALSLWSGHSSSFSHLTSSHPFVRAFYGPPLISSLLLFLHNGCSSHLLLSSLLVHRGAASSLRTGLLGLDGGGALEFQGEPVGGGRERPQSLRCTLRLCRQRRQHAKHHERYVSS